MPANTANTVVFNTSPEFIYSTACHEAGHAVAMFVAAIEFGLDVSNVVKGIRVDITGVGYLTDFNGDRQENCRGLVTCDDIWFDLIKRRDLVTIGEKQNHAHMLEMHTIAILAGPFAEAISQRREEPLKTENPSDFLEVEKISKRISSLNLPYSAFFRRSWTDLLRDACALVTGNWPAIEAMAQRLVVEGELSGKDALEILSASPVKLAA
ncbi:hypothetical protein HUN27_05085 [Agrobacterium tumefaciens]|nr:hypothetical protein [Agrobacterium tumefaciens]